VRRSNRDSQRELQHFRPTDDTRGVDQEILARRDGEGRERAVQERERGNAGAARRNAGNSGPAMTAKRSDELVWSPQEGPQQALVDCSLPEVFMGGARGGGKTDGVLGKWALKERYYKQNFNAIALRRTSVSFADAIERSREIYGRLGGRFNESKLTWRMPNGGRVAFGYLENVADAMSYQGRNLSDIWIEEVGQYPVPDPIGRMFGTLRSAHGVPTQMILTGNPGGPGQH